jgi:alpha-beta hydrolase superfamily lysophospholipase
MWLDSIREVDAAVAENRIPTFHEPRGDRLALPDGTPRAVALFAHCFKASDDGLAAAEIAHGLTELGIAVLQIDFAGLGQASGEPASTASGATVDDLVAAADQLRATLAAPALLIGHSLGGAAVLAAWAHYQQDQQIAA